MPFDEDPRDNIKYEVCNCGGVITETTKDIWECDSCDFRWEKK
jgi:hypothetical protein